MASSTVPAVELFSTSILSNHAVRKRHERYTSVLAIKKIPYVYHDMASDEDAKQRWRSKARDPTIPGLLVHNEWRGTFAEFEEAVEFDELDLFLAIDHERLKREQALLANANGQADEADVAPGTSANGAAADTLKNGEPAKPAKYTGEAPPPFAPEGTGKRRSLNADDFLKALGIDEANLDVNDAELAELLNDSSLRKANEEAASRLGVAGATTANGLTSNAAAGIGASAAARNAERKAQRAAMDEQKLRLEGLGPLAEGAPVELFTTSLLTNAGVRQRHERFLEVLSSNQVHFKRYDLIADEEAKQRWRSKSRDPQLPGVLVHGEWRGTFNDFDAAAGEGPDSLARWLNIDSRLANASVKAARDAAAAVSDKSAAETEDGTAMSNGRSKRFTLAIDDFLASLGVDDLKLDDADVDELLNGEGVPNVPGGQGAAIPPLLVSSKREADPTEAPSKSEIDARPLSTSVPGGDVSKPADVTAAEVTDESKPAEEAPQADEQVQDTSSETKQAEDPSTVAEPAQDTLIETEQVNGPSTEKTEAGAPPEETATTSNEDGKKEDFQEPTEAGADEEKEVDKESGQAPTEAVVEPTEDVGASDTVDTVMATPVAAAPEPDAQVQAEETVSTPTDDDKKDSEGPESKPQIPGDSSAAEETAIEAAKDPSSAPEPVQEADEVPPEPPSKDVNKEPPVEPEPAVEESAPPTGETTPATDADLTGASSPMDSPSASMRKPRKSKSRTHANAAVFNEEDEVSSGRRGMDYQRPSNFALLASPSLPTGVSGSPSSPLSPDGASSMSRSVSSSAANLSSSRSRSGSTSMKKGLGAKLSSMKFGKDKDKDRDRDRTVSGSSVADDEPSSLRGRPSREGLFKSRSRSPASAGRFKGSKKDQPPMPAVPRSLRAERTLSQILRDADEAMRSADAQMGEGSDADGEGGSLAHTAGGDYDDGDGDDGLDGDDSGEDNRRPRAPDPFGEDQVKIGL